MKLDRPIRNLLLILGDQLNEDSSLFHDYDPEQDLLWMAENLEEATYVWSHKIRLVLFFSAMRHFRDLQQSKNRTILYHTIEDPSSRDQGNTFEELLNSDVSSLKPSRIRVVKPGDLRVEKMLCSVSDHHQIPLDILDDTHFYLRPADFTEYSRGKKNLVMEHFYRAQRKRFDILMDEEGQPEGGEWNYDKQNRERFGKDGPGSIPPAPECMPDSCTRDVIEVVEKHFPDHPGTTDSFDWPVTSADAKRALEDFIDNRLPFFGKFEDAMWQNEHLLYHSRLSALLNLKLLNPRTCVDAAVEAFHQEKVPLNSVEGFVRQILGWREFIRGIYFQEMPEYAEANALECEPLDVPTFFWDGETDMACVKDSMKSVLEQAWSHHIPRLMVLGQFAMLLGVHPYKFHEWHMAMYADAIDWVSLPNTLGMSQFGDGGVVGSKPYCASGNYIHKMSNYCKDCPYTYNKAHGENACPFTTLYWDFLDRHQEDFTSNPRMKFQMANLKRKNPEDLQKIKEQAASLRQQLDPKSD